MVAESASRIPLRAHLVWFGAQLPWARALAVRSAALRGGFDEVVLHHDCDLSATPWYPELVETPKVRLCRLDLDELRERCAPHADALRAVQGRLHSPAMRSDLARLALLYSEGGVYLDTDTVTLASFEPLCASANAFCGEERIVYTAEVLASRNPAVFAASRMRSLLRDLLRRLSRGYRLFHAVEGSYPKAANNAILASVARSSFLEHVLEEMFELPASAFEPVYAIGPHLLQKTLARHPNLDLVVHPPEVFFPLGPEISEHWFRQVSRPDLGEVLSPATRLVHWYASVRTRDLLPRIDPDYVRRHAGSQLFSALALPFTVPAPA